MFLHLFPKFVYNENHFFLVLFQVPSALSLCVHAWLASTLNFLDTHVICSAYQMISAMVTAGPCSVPGVVWVWHSSPGSSALWPLLSNPHHHRAVPLTPNLAWRTVRCAKHQQVEQLRCEGMSMNCTSSPECYEGNGLQASDEKKLTGASIWRRLWLHGDLRSKSTLVLTQKSVRFNVNSEYPPRDGASCSLF